MSKVKQFLLKNWPMTLGTMIILSIVLYYVIFNGGVQVFHYDMIEQGIRFVQHGYDLLRTPGITFWDWNFYMGANIFSHGFYFLFSPFWLIFAALPSKDLVPTRTCSKPLPKTSVIIATLFLLDPLKLISI